MNAKPEFSVVTVVYNGVKNIDGTIASVLNQDYQNFEYIVIDGGSSDGTIEKIKSFGEKIDQFVSEPDRGIYDAMNKAAKLAKGKWIYFLNVGDYFYDDQVLSDLSKQITEASLVFGKHQSDYGYFQRIHKPAAIKNLQWGMIFSHQAMVAKTELLKQQLFDLKYKYSADYNFIYKLYKEGHVFKQVELIFAKLEAEGASELNITKTHKERWKISRTYEKGFSKFRHDCKYLIMLWELRFIKLLKFILPKKMVQKLTVRKYS